MFQHTLYINTAIFTVNYEMWDVRHLYEQRVSLVILYLIGFNFPTDPSSSLTSPVDDPEDPEKEEDNDEMGLQVKKAEAETSSKAIAPRWPTRVFAIDCLLKIITACETNPVHFNLSKAKELRISSKGLFFLFI